MKVIRDIVSDRKGITIIMVMFLVMLIVTVALALLPQVVNEREMTSRWGDATRAFYAAESGINIARSCMNEQNWAGFNLIGDTYSLIASPQPIFGHDGSTAGFYEVDVDLDENNDTSFDDPIATSIGYSANPLPVDRAQRSVRARFGRATFVTNGYAERGGAAVVDEDRIYERANFTFQDVFNGQTMAALKVDVNTIVVNNPSPNPVVPAGSEPFTDNDGDSEWDDAEPFTDQNGNSAYDAGEPYTDENGNGAYDPEEPYTDDNGNGRWNEKITWFVTASKVKITSTVWNGHGVLICEGDLEITGGIFVGLIYVSGDLTFAAGNAKIYGAVYVDGDINHVTSISGTSKISYDDDPAEGITVADIDNAIADIIDYNPVHHVVTSWEEIY